MRIFISVGEPSGDLHASNLIRQLRIHDPQLQAVGFGGPKMQDAGCESLFDLTAMGVMFIADAIRNYRLFSRLVRQADDYFKNNHVDAVVLIDYPGFNWWIAKKAKKHNIPVFYYGVPQMWAWAAWRISKIRKFVDHVICKLPFEQKWFADRGCKAHYVGHPYFDQLFEMQLDQKCLALIKQQKNKKLVLLLPGSRRFELANNLETLMKSADRIRQELPEVKFAIGCLNSEHAETCRPLCAKHGVEVYTSRTQELMTHADACIACSGSVSLELLYHRVPTVIVYKIGWLKMLLQMIVLKCKFITLTNLMNANDIRRTSWWPYNPDAENAEPTLMPEYLSTRDRSTDVSRRIVTWLKSESENSNKRSELNKLAERYANPGATSRAADYIISKLSESVHRKSAA